MKMYCYIRSERHLFTVGFYDPSGGWHPESDYESEQAAAKRVSELNGSGKATDEDLLIGLNNCFTMLKDNPGDKWLVKNQANFFLPLIKERLENA